MALKIAHEIWESPPHLSIPKKDHYSLQLKKALVLGKGLPSTSTMGLGSLLSNCGTK